MKIAIIVPAFNEEKNILAVLKEINNLDFDKKIIVVDDGSLDDTFNVVKKNFENVIILRHSINLGKGAALKTGCIVAMQLGSDLIATIDADNQHPPNILPKIVDLLTRDNLDVVIGARDANESMPLVSRLGNIFLSRATNYLFGTNISDTQSGLKVFKTSVYDKINWSANDYFVETEMVANIGKNKLKYGELKIDTVYNDVYKGTTFFDGIKIFFKIIKQKLK